MRHPVVVSVADDHGLSWDDRTEGRPPHGTGGCSGTTL